jgi:hypothetical protein
MQYVDVGWSNGKLAKWCSANGFYPPLQNLGQPHFHNQTTLESAESAPGSLPSWLCSALKTFKTILTLSRSKLEHFSVIVTHNCSPFLHLFYGLSSPLG